MENYQFFTLLIMLAGGFGWLIQITLSTRSDVSSLRNDHGQRLARIETKMESLEKTQENLGMTTRDLVNYLLTKKTGTET